MSRSWSRIHLAGSALACSVLLLAPGCEEADSAIAPAGPPYWGGQDLLGLLCVEGNTQSCEPLCHGVRVCLVTTDIVNGEPVKSTGWGRCDCAAEASGAGGASTGGASTGGASMGGASTGGASMGGASTGGASMGGASTGGASMGGASTSTGGSSAGGSAVTGGSSAGGSSGA